MRESIAGARQAYHGNPARAQEKEQSHDEQRMQLGMFKAESATIVDKLRALIHEGNVRRVVIEHDGRTVAEFPLTAGVLGAVIAPALAAIAAIVGLAKDCTVHVERAAPETPHTQAPDTPSAHVA